MKNNNGFAALMLNCENELVEKERWAIQARFQLSLVFRSGRRIIDCFEYIFKKPESNGNPKFIGRRNLLSLLTDDSVTIKARIIFIRDIGLSYSCCYSNANVFSFFTRKHVFNVPYSPKHVEYERRRIPL